MSSAASFETQTTPQEPTTPPTIRQQAAKAALSRWKLETLTGLLGIRAMQHHQRQNELNTAAENASVRRQLWNSETEAEAEDMGNTILGDVQYPTPIVVSSGQPPAAGGSGLLTGLAIAALGAAVPGAGLLGYVASQMLKPDPPAVQPVSPIDQPDFSVGLGKLEDYLTPD